jgi:hypothetical protein
MVGMLEPAAQGCAAVCACSEVSATFVSLQMLSRDVFERCTGDESACNLVLVLEVVLLIRMCKLCSACLLDA